MKFNSKKPALTSKSAYVLAVSLLARREHSVAELQRKLNQKGCVSSEVDAALDKLQAEKLLSDQRFTEVYISTRQHKGYGPQRILSELRERGIDAELAQTCLRQVDEDWRVAMRHQYHKKYAGTLPADYQDRCKRIGFLQSRGYPLDWVFALVEGSGE